MVASLVIGIIFLVAGLGLRYWINWIYLNKLTPQN